MNTPHFMTRHSVSARRYLSLALFAALSASALFTSVTSPSSAQKRVAVRLPAGEATTPAPATRAKERERERGREARGESARRMRRTQDGARLYASVSQSADTTGLPTVGSSGIQKTTAEVMFDQTNAPAARPRDPRLMVEHEGPDRKNLPQDPDALRVASTPGSGISKAASGAKAAPGSKGALTARPLGNVVRALDEPQTSAPQTASTSFTGATLADTGAFPPDTMGAVGPTQFFVFVNGRLRTFNKTTGAADGVVNVDSDVFFSPVMTPVPAAGVNFTSDPNVRFDRLTNRWFLTIIDVPSSTASTIGDTPNRLLIAVSDAASNGVVSAGTVWTFYFVQQDTVGVAASTGEFLDYPSLGIDNNALYVGGNMFGAVSGSFVNSTAFVIRKSSVLGGGPVVATAFRGILPNGTADGPFAPRGVDNYDAAATEGYFIGVSNAAFGRLIIRRVSDPGGTPTISANILLTVSSTAFPITVDHFGDTGGTNGNLDALDDRLYAAHIRRGRLWTAHNIGVTAAGTSGGTTTTKRNGVRWYELNGVRSADNGGTPVVVQSGTIFDAATTVSLARQYFIPSVMVSGQGHAAFGYSTAGTPFRIDAATNGRLSGDALGTTGAVALYTASSTAYNPPSDPGPPRRWGDYSFTSLDPNDDMTMWTIQEFCSGANVYGVRVVKLLAPAPATPTTAAPSIVNQGVASTNVVITGTSVAGSGFFDPGANLAPPAQPFNHISASVTGGVVVNSVTYTDPTHVTLNISTVGATPGPQSVTVTNPDGQSMPGSATITVAAAAPPATAGQVLISEFRFRGPLSAADEYVELYNTTSGAVDISGYTLHALTAAGAQSLRFTVPGALGSNTTNIPAHGHYLITGASYSLAATAASDGVLSTGIVDGSGIGLFAGALPSAATRIDSVGFDSRDALFFEGTPITPSGAGTGGITVGGEYAFVRRMTTGFPQDSDNNDADFLFVSATGGTFTTRVSALGAPGPEGLASPVLRAPETQIKSALLDPAQAASAAPNRVRTQIASCPACDSTKSNLGTLEIRRKFFNNTGANVTRLRFRIVDVTTLNNRIAAEADLRALTATGSISVTLTGGTGVTVQSLTLEAPSDAVTNGGGLNSTLAAGTITGIAPLGPGAAINVNFLLGVQQGGNFRFLVTIEALP